MNHGISWDELQSGKPIIGIAQTGSDLVACERHRFELAQRVREGTRQAGGIALEFPVHPLYGRPANDPPLRWIATSHIHRDGRGAVLILTGRRRADDRV